MRLFMKNKINKKQEYINKETLPVTISITKNSRKSKSKGRLNNKDGYEITAINLNKSYN